MRLLFLGTEVLRTCIPFTPVLARSVFAGCETYLHAHIHLRFRHAHHEIKDLLPSLGSRGRMEKGCYCNFENYQNCP